MYKYIGLVIIENERMQKKAVSYVLSDEKKKKIVFDYTRRRRLVIGSKYEDQDQLKRTSQLKCRIDKTLQLGPRLYWCRRRGIEMVREYF